MVDFQQSAPVCVHGSKYCLGITCGMASVVSRKAIMLHYTAECSNAAYIFCKEVYSHVVGVATDH